MPSTRYKRDCHLLLIQPNHMPELILHHYPQSPVTEKVRVVLGIKSLDWRSVEIPRIPPKPDLMPLTGGYRRTPVMQIGADIYCDSLCIIREIERRYPEPNLFSGDNQGLAWGISRWVDGPLFKNAITVVLGAAENLPEDFAADRGRLYFGPDFDLGAVQAEVEQSAAQLHAQLGWFEQYLESGRRFMHGAAPGLMDALAYYIVWFLRGRWTGGSDLIDQFSLLSKWEIRVRAIGHGQQKDLESAKALDIALKSEARMTVSTDTSRHRDLEPGIPVGIVPEGNGGDPVVQGILASIDAESVSLTREHERIGEVVVHFPRVGYRVIRL
jgi:glutathione S-transferase